MGPKFCGGKSLQFSKIVGLSIFTKQWHPNIDYYSCGGGSYFNTIATNFIAPAMHYSFQT